MKDYIERASVHSIIEQTSTFAFTRGGMHERVDSLPWAVAASNRARQKGVGLLRVQDTGEPALEVVPDVWVPDG